ncbi:MAG: precorrin-8X methylmutase [Thermodesulfobacteriota bacterium]
MINWNLPPEEIERLSFEIIDRETPAHDWPPEAWRIVRRLIHTSADFEYVASVRMHTRAISSGLEALRQGRSVVTDTRMALSGLSLKRLEPLGVKTVCLIDHPEVKAAARNRNTTRAAAAVDLALEAAKKGEISIGLMVIGNAPTALFRLLERLEAGDPAPNLIIGLPVGFVHAAEAKAALVENPVPYLTALGRKGGSNVAAAAVNALAELAAEPL